MFSYGIGWVPRYYEEIEILIFSMENFRYGGKFTLPIAPLPTPVWKKETNSRV